MRNHPCTQRQTENQLTVINFSTSLHQHCWVHCKTRAHPDLNQGPADLQSAALTTELCTHLATKRVRTRMQNQYFISEVICRKSHGDFSQASPLLVACSLSSVVRAMVLWAIGRGFEPHREYCYIAAWGQIGLREEIHPARIELATFRVLGGCHSH